MDANDLCGIAHRARFENALQIGEPTFFLTQPCQRRPGQGIVAASAMEAVEALQSACLAAAVLAGTAAVRTWPSCRRLFDQRDALGRVRDAGKPFPRPGQVAWSQLHGQQHGEHLVERQAAHRHSS
jgi:hypothetical protein